MKNRRLRCSLRYASATLEIAMRWPRLFLVLLLLAGGARAAEIHVVPLAHGRGVLITVEGEFTLDDGPRFAAIAHLHDRAIVVFNSPGGALLAGLQMGQLIRLKHFSTFVPQKALCASACAIAWLGGAPRMMQPESHIGFHQAFYGAHQVAGVGNALMGAYMAQLGLGFETIEYFEKAAPQNITWLTSEDADRLGIQLVVVPSEPGRAPASEPGPGTGPAPTPAVVQPGPVARRLLPFLSAPLPKPPPLPRSLSVRARQFALRYFSHWSEANGAALDYFAHAYAEDVVFYGSRLPRAALMVAKERFATKWPVRVYSVRPSGGRPASGSTSRPAPLSARTRCAAKPP
jgi:hypothetical protein